MAEGNYFDHGPTESGHEELQNPETNPIWTSNPSELKKIWDNDKFIAFKNNSETGRTWRWNNGRGEPQIRVVPSQGMVVFKKVEAPNTDSTGAGGSGNASSASSGQAS